MDHIAIAFHQIDVGNTAFMLLCTSLVMLMTPGLAFFYGGLVSRKDVLTIMLQSFVSMGWVAILWFVVGYSLCFGPTVNGIIGDPTYYAFLTGVKPWTMYTGNSGGIPLIVHIGYQMMFAIITPALITGAFVNRVTFRAYMIFLTLWLLLVYCPFVHMVWSPNGLFAKWGVLDFAGGIVVHATAGFAALASALYVGKRAITKGGEHSIPFIALGAGLLWFGWYGFNAGSELRVNTVTVSAFFATDIAAACAAITWLIIEYFHTRKPKFVGFLTGSIAGLATITPAAGYVSLQSAALIGVLASLVCYFTVALMRKYLDDALDVFGVHGMGGITGSILLGVFATQVWNPQGASGLLDGNVNFLFKQIVAVVFASVWSFVLTYGILWFIDKLTPVRVKQEYQLTGIDEGLLGEEAYPINK